MTQHLNVDGGHPLVLASEDDRDWFEDHPDRVIRLRHRTDGDGDPEVQPRPLEPNQGVIVFCPTDGVRFRFGVSIIPGSPAEAFLRGDEHSDLDLAPTLYQILPTHPMFTGHASARLQSALVQCMQQGGGRLAHWSLGDDP